MIIFFKVHCNLRLVHRELHNEDLSSSSPLHLACRWIDHHYWLSPKQVQNRHHIRIFCRRKALTIKSSCQNTFACNHGILGVLKWLLSVQLHSSKTLGCKNPVPAKPSLRPILASSFAGSAISSPSGVVSFAKFGGTQLQYKLTQKTCCVFTVLSKASLCCVVCKLGIFLYNLCHLVTDFCKFGKYSVWWIVLVKRSLDLEGAKFTFSFSGFVISLPSGIYKELLRWL